MTNEDKVRSRFPNAVAEYGPFAIWTVWDISPAERKRLDEKHWPEKVGRMVCGLGDTEADAWRDAVRAIENREGIQLPVKKADQ